MSEGLSLVAGSSYTDCTTPSLVRREPLTSPLCSGVYGSVADHSSPFTAQEVSCTRASYLAEDGFKISQATCTSGHDYPFPKGRECHPGTVTDKGNSTAQLSVYLRAEDQLSVLVQAGDPGGRRDQHSAAVHMHQACRWNLARRLRYASRFCGPTQGIRKRASLGS